MLTPPNAEMCRHDSNAAKIPQIEPYMEIRMFWRRFALCYVGYFIVTSFSTNSE